MSPDQLSIAYEQPLNERVRSLLRLELLFAQHEHHAQDASSFGLRARLGALLDILTVLSRSDLKKDVYKELIEQRALLERLGSRSDVDHRRLQDILGEIEAVTQRIQPLLTHFSGTPLRENEFLIAIYNRISIPGGTCAFDLPAYHCWLSQPVAKARADLDAWYTELAPFYAGVRLYLRLLRGSVESITATARDGVYIHNPQAAGCSLLRVFLPAELALYPEISAGAHRFTIRFMQFENAQVRTTQTHQTLSFQLQCCSL